MASLRDRDAQRADQILHAAREVYLLDGWDYFSFERIAEFVECSRPLIYRHFSSREELMLALAIQSKQRRVRLLERALAFQGRTREKMIAVGEIEGLLMPRDLPIEMFVASTCLRAKTSRARQEELKVMDTRAVHMSANVIREAVAEGDVILPDDVNPEEMLFSFWAIFWGGANMMRSDTPLRQIGIQRPMGAILSTAKCALDGYGWKPLSNDYDYTATRRRIFREVYPPNVIEEILGEGLPATHQQK